MDERLSQSMLPDPKETMQKILNDQIFSFMEKLVTIKQNSHFFKKDARKYGIA